MSSYSLLKNPHLLFKINLKLYFYWEPRFVNHNHKQSETTKHSVKIQNHVKSSQITVDEGIIPELPTMTLTTKMMAVLLTTITKLIPDSIYLSKGIWGIIRCQRKSIGFYYCTDETESTFCYLLCKKTVSSNSLFMK